MPGTHRQNGHDEHQNKTSGVAHRILGAIKRKQRRRIRRQPLCRQKGRHHPASDNTSYTSPRQAPISMEASSSATKIQSSAAMCRLHGSERQRDTGNPSP